MNDAVKVLIISMRSEYRRLYEGLVENVGVNFDSVDSLRDALSNVTRNVYNGIIIDLQTLIKTDMREKEHIRDMLDAYPVAKVQAARSEKNVRIISAGKCASKCATIEDFIRVDCLHFKARLFRHIERKTIKLPILLSFSRPPNEDNAEKTFTVNISPGGAYVFTAGEWEVDDCVWIRLLDTDCEIPTIAGEIRWGIPWGEKAVIPGVGIRFKEVSEEQASVIFQLTH